MVAERKELERNALAQQLGRAYEGIRHGPSRGTVIFVAAIFAAALIFVVFRYFFYLPSVEAASHRWYQLDTVLFPEQLDEYLEKDKETPQYRLARFKEARLKLAAGLRDLGNPTLRQEAHDQIEEGTRIYEELAKSAGRIPLLHQEALWGAAKGHEALGDPDAAIKLYKQLKDDYENSALGKDAKKQLERLNSDATRKELIEIRSEFKTAGK